MEVVISMKRPFLCIAIFFIVNIFFYLMWGLFWVVFLNILFFCVGFILQLKEALLFWMAAIILFLFLLPHYGVKVDYRLHEKITLVGKVKVDSFSSDDQFYLESGEIGAKILVYYKGNVERLVGKTVVCTVQLEKPMTRRNPKVFDYLTYLKSQNVQYVAFLDKRNLQVKYAPVMNIDRWIYHVQKKIYYKIKKIYTHPKVGSFVTGIILGNKAFFRTSDLEKFYSVGLGHILVVSGLHFGIFYFLLGSFFRWIPIGYNMKKVSVLIILFIFLGIVGFNLSAVRAFLIILLYEVTYYYNRRLDLLNILGLITLIIVVYNPYSVYSLGFILSIGTIMSIAFFYNKMDFKAPSAVKALFSVQIFIFLVSIHIFNSFNIFGLILNVIVLSCLNVLFLMILVNFLLYPTYVITFVISKVILLIYTGVEFGTKAEVMTIFFRSFTKVELSVIFLVFLMLVVKYEHEKLHIFLSMKRIVIVFLCLILISNIFSYFDQTLYVYFFDVGQGDSILLKNKSMGTLVIDTGKDQNYNQLNELLLKNNVKTIDFLVLTHSDFDHIGGAAPLFKTHRIKYLVLPDKKHVREEFKGVLAQCTKETKIIYVDYGDRFSLGEMKLSVLNPINKEIVDSNQASVVLELRYKSRRLLFTGDIDDKIEKQLTGALSKKYDVLKVSHHGSKYSTCKKFIDRVDPSFAVIQVGENNYGHPNQRVIKLLDEYAKIYRTDKDGCIIFKINDKIEIETIN